jgi:parvulin-like peptidyl-prolyl isomerase
MNKWLKGIVLGVWLVSCSSGSSSQDKLPDNVAIVIINKEEVSLEQFKAEFNVYKKKFRVNSNEDISPEELTWLKNRVLEQIIHNTLLRQEIKNNEIEISQEELNEALLKVETGYPEDSFEKQLKFEGLTRKEWEYTIENNLLIKKLISNLVNSKVSVSDEEMRRYFEANESKFHKREQVRALHIMVETEEEIRQIQKELRSKQKKFSELAEEFSLGPEGTRGGDLGYFEAGQMPEEFDNVFKLKVNGVSDIIRTPYGFHLFKVVEKIKERKMSLDESRKSIEQILLQELQDAAFQKWLVQLKEKSEIEIKYDFFEKIN